MLGIFSNGYNEKKVYSLHGTDDKNDYSPV